MIRTLAKSPFVLLALGLWILACPASHSGKWGAGVSFFAFRLSGSRFQVVFFRLFVDRKHTFHPKFLRRDR